MHTLTGTGSRHRSIEILMARFDVYANRRGGAFLLDVQTDLITRLSTRVDVALLPLDAVPTVADRLNPIFEVQGSKVLSVRHLNARQRCSFRCVAQSPER